MSSAKPPLVLTLAIDDEAAVFFSGLRKKYFPPERNYLNAHLCLFHALPNEQYILDTLDELAQSYRTFDLLVKEVVSIGNGVAYKIESASLMQLHKILQRKWIEYLTLQDRHKIWPHITVQNKVAAAEANILAGELKNGFESFPILATGLQVFEYLGGPWKHIRDFSFSMPG